MLKDGFSDTLAWPVSPDTEEMWQEILYCEFRTYVGFIPCTARERMTCADEMWPEQVQSGLPEAALGMGIISMARGW